MLTLKKDFTPEGIVLELSGVLDASVNYQKEIGNPSPVIIIHAKQISHVNSSAVRPWLTYFQRAHEQGTKLVFRECSAAMVDFFNAAPAALCEGQVESVICNFYCKRCLTEIRKLLDIRNIVDIQAVLDRQTCPACRLNLAFDEAPEVFFAFLKEQKK